MNFGKSRTCDCSSTHGHTCFRSLAAKVRNTHAITINGRSSSDPARYDCEISVISSWQTCARAPPRTETQVNPLQMPSQKYSDERFYFLCCPERTFVRGLSLASVMPHSALGVAQGAVCPC